MIANTIGRKRTLNTFYETRRRAPTRRLTDKERQTAEETAGTTKNASHDEKTISDAGLAHRE